MKFSRSSYPTSPDLIQKEPQAVVPGIQTERQIQVVAVARTPRREVLNIFRGPVDEFFFTIVYAIIVYMIGMSSFKLIDQIPNQILRWMGQGVSTFNDDRGEPAEGLISKMAIGGGMAGQQIQGAFASGKEGIGKLAQGFTEKPKG